MYINKKDDGTIELTAPVMIPGARDCDYKNGEPPLTKEQISEFAKTYENYQFIDHEHGLTRNGVRIGTPTNSFLLSEDTTLTLPDGSLKNYPEGSWFITAHLTNEDAINTALEGGYTGYSASVFSKNRADEYLAALKENKDTPLPTACKSISSGGTALIKDVPDPVVLSVSLVKSPCLHDSKFCEIGEIMEDDVKSMKSKILNAMGMSDEAEVVALKEEVQSLESKIDEMKAEFDKALSTLKGEFEKILSDALTPVDKEETEEKAEEEPAAEKTEEVEETEPVEEAPEEEVEEVVAEEPVAEKGESKAEPVHDNIQAEKKRVQNIYEALGRNPDGTRKL